MSSFLKILNVAFSDTKVQRIWQMVAVALFVICCKIVNLQGRPISRLWVSECCGGVGVRGLCIIRRSSCPSILMHFYASDWSLTLPDGAPLTWTGSKWLDCNDAHCIIDPCCWLTQNTHTHQTDTLHGHPSENASSTPTLPSINIYPGVLSPTSASHASAPTSLITQRGSQKAFPVTAFQLDHPPLLAFSTSVLWNLLGFQLVTWSGLLNVAVGHVLSELYWLLITPVTGWRRLLAILRFIQPHAVCSNSSYFAVNDRNLHKNRCSSCEQLVRCFAFRLSRIAPVYNFQSHKRGICMSTPLLSFPAQNQVHTELKLLPANSDFKPIFWWMKD